MYKNGFVYQILGYYVGRKSMKKRSFVLATALASLALFSVDANAEGLKNIPEAPKGGRFKTPTDLVWPAQAGQGDVCLWKDDKFAALAITIDDNCKKDHEWWLKICDELGIKVTWFVITDKVGKINIGFNGTWEDWQKLANAGHSIQSHTTNHKSNKKDDPNKMTEEEIVAQYRDSLAIINENVTNNFACTIAYPNGVAHPEIAARYAIGARGVYGVPSPANNINYMCTNKGAASQAFIDAILYGKSEHEPKWMQNRPNLKRGLNIILYHLVHWGHSPEQIEQSVANVEAEVRNIAKYKDVIWIARFDDLMKYGQERDTAKLVVDPISKTGEISFKLTCDMDLTLFDYPLTIKLCLGDKANSITAMQGEKNIPARIVEHDGKAYAIVDALPNGIPVKVSYK